MTLRHAALGALGLLLGYSLSRIGFADFGEVHRLFTLADLRMLYVFGGAVALTLVAFAVFGRGHQFPSRPIHRGTVVGGVLFGLGWAITGGCPGGALVQVGNGYLPALITVGGILLGTAIYPRLHARFFRFDPGTCDG